jgi:predicted alpha/beta superfamily hydrolase
MKRLITAILVLTLTLGFGCSRDPSGAKPQAESQDAKKTTPENEAKEQSEVTIELSVDVPPETPKDATVYLAGSLPQLGATWKPNGLALSRDPSSPNRWRTTLKLPKGVVLEYKLTLGGWERVERDAAGNSIVNRRLKLDGDQRVQIAVASWANENPSAPRQTTLTGDIRFHRNVWSSNLRNRRDIAVYLPPEYEKSMDRYPVLYMHDGQNLFDDATSFGGEWRADETAERLIKAGTIRPVIIVGIANAGNHRMAEYTMSVDKETGIGGFADKYARFVLEEVKPMIDQTYRTMPDRANTAVGGSSLGGLVSLHIARRHPDKVGLVASVSPSLWWNEKEMIRAITADPAWLKNTRVWLDMGTAEDNPTTDGSVGKNLAATRELAAFVNSVNLPDGRFHYDEVEGADHSEPAWAARFDRILIFLFGK